MSSRPFSACSGVSPLFLRRSHHRLDIGRADALRIDDLELGGQIDAVRLRDGADAFGIAQQDAMRDALLGADRGGPDGARLVALGQDDAAVGGARRLDEAVTEHRRRHQQLDRRVETARQRPDVDPLGDEIDHPLHALAVGAADVTGEIGEPRRRGESVVGASPAAAAGRAAGCAARRRPPARDARRR